jgi:hypothetical protein
MNIRKEHAANLELARCPDEMGGSFPATPERVAATWTTEALISELAADRSRAHWEQQDAINRFHFDEPRAL